MFGLNPYTLLGGAVAALALVATLHYQSHEIHKYHSMLECVQDGKGCANPKIVTVPGLQQKIRDMTTAQNNQTATTERVVTKVVQAPAQVVTKTIVKEIHDAPMPVDCKKSPEFPQDVKDSY